MTLELLSIDLSNFCSKQCSFCYNHSTRDGNTVWTPDEVIRFVSDCIGHGIKAVSLGGGEPFAIFFLAFEPARAEKEVRLVRRADNADFAVPLNKFLWPAKEVFPIVAANLPEDLLAVHPGDVFKALFARYVQGLAEEADDVAFVRAEIDVFHGAGADGVVYEFDCGAIAGCECDGGGHDSCRASVNKEKRWFCHRGCRGTRS